MTMLRQVLLALGMLCILTFIIMVTFLIVVGQSTGDGLYIYIHEMYLACMIVCVPIGIGCIVAAYMEGEY
jgi:hypothetical protein